jgi:RNA polymerase sigma-70 factor (ECF subfamily)
VSISLAESAILNPTAFRGETLLTTARGELAYGASEAEAIEGAKQGDGECFEFLYSRHKRRVYSLCLRMIGNIDAAEDVTQEVFLQLYRKIASFRGDSSFATWLHRVTVNIILMRLRKKGLIEVSLEETLRSIEDDDQKREFGSEDKLLAGSIDRVLLERATESLPPGYRITFILHDIEGYEHGEIAELLGCSISNSKSQLHKARLKLREVLDVARAENNRRGATRKMKTLERLAMATGRGVRAAATAA